MVRQATSVAIVALLRGRNCGTDWRDGHLAKATEAQVKALPTFSPVEVQADRIENELHWIQSVVSGQYDPRGYGVSKPMFIGEGAADVFETLCALWTGGVLPIDARFKRTLKFAALRAGMPAARVEMVLEPGPSAHADYLADQIREAYQADSRVRIASEITSRSQRGEDTGELVAELAELQQPEESKRLSFAGCDVADLQEYTDQEVDWLVDGVFGADQPTLFGARSKATKTSQLVDLSVALASHTKWLGFFDVPKRRRVLFITGEANNRAITKRIQRAAISRGKSLSDLAGWLRVEAVNFPKLPNLEHCEAIQRDVQSFGADVVIVDPLYRGIPSDLDTNRMASVGDAIVQFAHYCQPASLILSHHTTKSAAREYGSPPELEDMTGAGIAESCGNWWLLGRNKKYEWDWIHDLCVQFGGRDEQAGARRIVFNEKDWTFEVEGFRDYIDQTQNQAEEKREAAKEQARRQKHLQAKAATLAAIKTQSAPISKSQLQSLAGVHRGVFEPALAELLRELVIAIRPYTDSQGRAQAAGYLLATKATELDRKNA
jgi:hypothetical protein